MARLTKVQWEKARAAYEVRGISFGLVARTFGVSTSSVSRRAKVEGWIQGRDAPLVERQVKLFMQLAEIEIELRAYPPAYRRIVDQIVLEQLLVDALQKRLREAAATGAGFDMPDVIRSGLDGHARTTQTVNDLANRLTGILPRHDMR